MKHVMVDIETFGDKSNSDIASIGAIKFDINTGETFEEFYDVIDIDSCLDAGLQVNGSTIKWWLTRNEKARKEIARGGHHLQKVLFDFSEFLEGNEIMWSNGLRFDISKLEDSYRICKLNVPWDFHNERDVRTLVSFKPEIKEKHVVENLGIHHHPIDDCKIQIKYCTEIYKNIKI